LVDDINLKIIEELVKNQNTSSMSLATKLRMPHSSLQRRRAKLEKAVFVKVYHINLKTSGGKMDDVVINVDKGKCREVATNILKKFKVLLRMFPLVLIQNTMSRRRSYTTILQSYMIYQKESNPYHM